MKNEETLTGGTHEILHSSFFILHSFSAVILAGGKSSRMGRDKAWLEVAGRTLLARQIALVRQAGAAEVFVSGRAGVDYSEFGCVVLHDEFADAGPLAGIAYALAMTNSPSLLVVAVDLPAMTAGLLRELGSHRTEASGAVPLVCGSIEPLAAFYPKASGAIAQEMLAAGRFAARDFAERCVTAGLARLVNLPPDAAPFFANWNSPADVRG